MVEQELLKGKVRVWNLPQVQPGPNELLQKRVMLPQGELAQFYDGEEGMRYIASIELKQGTVRGNHYHKIKREYVYILSGRVSFVSLDLETDAREEIELAGGSLAFIEPGIVHALDVKENGLAVEFSPNRFDASDTYREKLV
jgi:quercetin dioxygenase-like cupin family protein